jgi:multiple sugar transport system substrate-binding protein
MASMPNLPKISLSRNQIIMVAGALVLIVTVFLLFRFFGSKKPPGEPVTLAVWGVDSPDAFKGVIAGYQTLRPNVTVNYTQVPAVGYDQAILKALASGKGPDIFYIGNHDLLRLGDLLVPAPAAQVSLPDIQSVFPQAVTQDFVYGGSIYALPLYMDTLALLYNKQMFDQASIATPPATWQDVLDIVPKLREVDANGQIARAGMAIGGSEKSIVHATDILNMVMLQNGVTLANDAGQPFFAGTGPSAAAFQFYLQFADSASPAYTWNDLAGRSLESFAAQKSAMALAYQSDLQGIEKQAPFLDYGVVAAPQVSVDRAVNYPSYHGLAVWVGSGAPAWAWDLILFASTNSSAQSSYLAATGRPAALRSLIAAQQRDPNLAVFAKASLTARSWKMGDYDKIKTIFSNAIQNVQTGAKTQAQALGDAETQAKQLVPR